MELDKQTIKKIIGLISFAILLSWGLKNTEVYQSVDRTCATGTASALPDRWHDDCLCGQRPDAGWKAPVSSNPTGEAPCRTGCCRRL